MNKNSGTLIIGGRAGRIRQVQVRNRHQDLRRQVPLILQRVRVRHLLPLGRVVRAVGVGPVVRRIAAVEGVHLRAVGQHVVEGEVDGALNTRG